MLKRKLFLLCSSLLLWSCTSFSLVFAQDIDTSGPIAGTPLERRMVQEDSGRRVTYYMSRPKSATAPIMLMIQGSGCAPLLTIRPGGASTTMFNLIKYAAEGKFTVIAVEKPFSGSAPQPGWVQGCSPAFHADFTAESWQRAIHAALKDARKAAWVEPTRTLVFGTSEGAVMAAVMAASDPSITDVIAISGSGTTQLFDFVAQAYRSCFDVAACLKDIQDNVAAIMADPHSSTAFAWGHPHKRWSSFFSIDPGELLLKSKARVYIAMGTADDSVPAISQELAVAKLVLGRKDVTVRRVADGTHSLNQREARNWDALDREQGTALEWFSKAK